MANKTNTEQLGASIHNLLHPNQQRAEAQSGLGNTSQKVEILQKIDSDKVKINAKTIRQWRKLAKQGKADAQSALGFAYYKGNCIDDRHFMDNHSKDFQTICFRR